MKKTLIVASFITGALLAAAANAGPFGLPDHQQNGFRDTGCDAAAAKPIANSNAVSNPTCKQNLGYTSTKVIPTAGGDGVFGTPDDGSRTVTDN